MQSMPSNISKGVTVGDKFSASIIHFLPPPKGFLCSNRSSPSYEN